ncbi:MAG: VWA domain-containing protein [Planctomycetes bacterium]|nr:VWA domain-containing protein [Planctomycetota bacterium]
MTSLITANSLLYLSVLAVVLVGFYSFVLYRETRREYRLSFGQSVILWLMRCAVALLVLVTLARPAYQHTRTEERLPVVALLVDESLSMGFPDSRDNPLSQAQSPDRRTRYHTAQLVAQKAQEKLSRTHRVRVYTFSDALSLMKELPHRPSDTDSPLTRDELFAGHPLPTGDHSNIGDALTDGLRELSGEKVSAMLLLTDGRQTGGLDLPGAAEQANAAKVPVHTITLGSEFPLRDLRIDEINVGAEASLGDVLTFQVKVTNQISAPLATELTLEERDGSDTQQPYKEVVRRKLILQRGQQNVPIITIPMTEGLRQFRFSLPRQPEEVNVENNVAEVSVKVVKRTLKVLLIAGQPSREYYYLVPALLRDPILDVSTFLQSADVDYIHQGNTVIERLPATLKDWQAYDVCILFDVDPNGITTQQLAGLENMVRTGGGLMVLTGRSHGLAKLVQVHAAKIRGMLPVEIDKNLNLDHDVVFDKPFKAVRTARGKNHPIFLSTTDQNVNEQIWDSFQKLNFWWYHPVMSLKPKAISLLEREGKVAGEASLMAIHRYDDGAVFFSALDALWQWRYPSESYDYDRLWTRMIRYLGEARLLGTQQQVALTTDRRSYNPGENVEIGLRVLDPALLAQLAGQQLYVAVASEAKDPFMVPLTLDAQGEPLYRGNYRARRVGSMVVHARQTAPDAPSDAKPIYDVKHGFQVRMQSLEEADTSADLKSMETLAQRTGGHSIDHRTMDDLDALLKSIPIEPQVRTETVVEEIWDSWPLLILFLVLVSVELSLRKWWGLL